MPETVSIIDRYGLQRDVPVEVAQEELSVGGAVLESPEAAAARIEAQQYGGLTEQAKGIGEAALRGATLGLSDVGLTEALGEDYREAAAARQRQTGMAGTVAEVGGAVAPLLLSGGTGLAARGASLIGAPTRAAAAAGGLAERAVARGLGAVGVEGAGVLSRGAATGARLAAGGAVEGSLYGAGAVLSEEALAGGSYDKLGEKIWSGIRSGAGVGAIGGGVLGFAGGATSKAAERGLQMLTGGEGLRQLVRRFADTQVGKALGATSRDIQNLGASPKAQEAALARLAADIRTAKLADGRKVLDMADSAGDIAEKAAVWRRETGESLDAFRKQIDDYVEGPSRAGFDDPALAEMRPQIGSFKGQVDSMAMELRSSGIPELVQRARKVEETFEGLFKRAEDGIGLGELTKWRTKLDDVIYPQRAGGLRSGGLPPPPPIHRAELVQARAWLEDTIEAATEKAAKQLDPAMAGKYAELKGQYRSAKQAQDIAQGGANRDQGGRTFGLTDYLTGVGGAAASVASGNVLPLLAAGAGSIANKLARERGSSVLALMADRVARADKLLDKGVKKFFKRADDARRGVIGAGAGEEVEERRTMDAILRKRGKESQGDAYRRTLREAAELTRDPINALERKLGTKMAASAPQTTMAVTSAAIRGAQFLIDKAPVGLSDPDALLPQFEPMDPDPVEMARYTRYLQVVEDPYSVLDELADGTLTSQHVEALKVVYPAIYEDVQTRVWSQLMEQKAPPPYEYRIQLGTLLDLPTDKSLRPESIAAAQAVYADREERAANPPPQKSSGGGIAKTYATKIQQLEGSELDGG